MQPLGPAHLLDPKEAQKLNLAVLKRIDSKTEQVLASANHVALYDFDQQDSRWVRKDVEGSLFLIKRSVEPLYQIIILNKKSHQNYVEDVLAAFQFEKSRPYLLYRNKNDEVVGIWFYEEDEADKVETLLHRILAAYPTTSTAPSGHEQAAQSRGEGNNAGDDAFWDQRAPSPPADFDPFAGRVAGGAAAAAASPAPPLVTPGPAPAMMTPGPPAPPSGTPIGATPPKSPGSFLRGVNGLRDGRAMTPEQSNLAKLLANMKVASCGGIPPTPTQATTTPTPPPQSTPHHSASASDLQHPALLTPKFFTARQAQPPAPPSGRVGGPVESSHNSSSVPSISTDAAGVQRASSDPLSAAAALQEPQKQPLGDTSLSRFFPLAGLIGASQQQATPPALSKPEKAAAPPAVPQREQLRQAITVLAESDAFLDVLAKELAGAGLWR